MHDATTISRFRLLQNARFSWWWSGWWLWSNSWWLWWSDHVDAAASWLTDSDCGPSSKGFGLLQRDLPFSLWMSVCLAAQPDRFASKFAIAAILTNDGPLLHFASEFPANNKKKRLCLAGNSRQAFVCIKTNCKILCVCVLQNNQSSYPTVVFVSASKLNSLAFAKHGFMSPIVVN